MPNFYKPHDDPPSRELNWQRSLVGPQITPLRILQLAPHDRFVEFAREQAQVRVAARVFFVEPADQDDVNVAEAAELKRCKPAEPLSSRSVPIQGDMLHLGRN